MASWAQIDDNNIVTQVLVCDDGEDGYKWLTETLGGKWIQTSYSGAIRKNFAGIGYTYDETLDAFIPIKPFDSWVLDESTCQWVAPSPYPEDGSEYFWNETTTQWEQTNG